MEEKKEIRIKLSTVIYLLIIVVLIISLGLTYYFGFVVDKNDNMNNEQQDNLTENVLSNTSTENKEEENVVEDSKINNNIKDETDKKEEITDLKGEKLVQFDNEFFELKDIAKEYREYQKIKNYKDFNYDLDGDGITDKVTLSHKTEKTDNGVGGYHEEDIYSVKLNDKTFSNGTLLDSIYIVDLNENDKNIEVVIFDDGPSDDPNYTIYSKQGSQMVELENICGSPLKTDRNGTVIVDSSFNIGENGNTSPAIYLDYYIINNNKMERKFIDVDKIKNIDLQTESLYFSKNLNNLDKFYQEGGLDENKLKGFDIEKLDKSTTFKLLDFEFSTDENDIEENKIYVKLSDGRKGYIFHIQWAG